MASCSESLLVGTSRTFGRRCGCLSPLSATSTIVVCTHTYAGPRNVRGPRGRSLICLSQFFYPEGRILCPPLGRSFFEGFLLLPRSVGSLSFSLQQT